MEIIGTRGNTRTRDRVPRLARRRRAVAWTTSAGFHLIVFVMLFARASGDLRAADSGGAAVAGMNVTLVRASAFSAPAPSAPGGDLRPLLARFGSEQPPVVVDEARPTNDLARLLQRIEQTQAPSPAPTERPPRPIAPVEDEPDAGALTLRQSRRGTDGPTAGAAQAGSTGGLWGAVAPCWRRAAPGSQVPVTLEVVLDARAQLATPPSIIRPAGGRLDEGRLRSEALALAALDACLPRGDLRFGGARYRLEFGPRG